MSEYKIFVGKDQKDYFDAVLKHQFFPTAETEARLKELSEKATKDLTEIHEKKSKQFVMLYGQELFDFVNKLSKPYFLVGKDSPFSLSWDVKADYENDNYWGVYFSKGVFSYRLSICGGYCGHETLEENISQERVIELLSHPIDNEQDSI